MYSKACVKGPLPTSPKNGFQDQLSLNAGQNISECPEGREHSAIIWTFIKLPIVIKVFVLSIFEWPYKTGFTVASYNTCSNCDPGAKYCPALGMTCFFIGLYIT